MTKDSDLSPYGLVALSAGTYAALFRSLTASKTGASPVPIAIRRVSSIHATITTALALYALGNCQWTIPEQRLRLSRRRYRGDGSRELDDEANPLISGRCSLANALTAWEAGYLLYDTWAMIHEAHDATRPNSTFQALAQVAKKSPFFLVHHVALASGLTYLQWYISTGYDTGIWIMTAFLLMNASNPLLNAMSLMRKRTGKVDRKLELAFIVLFALCRFGTVFWVLKRYGEYHGLGAWDAYKKLRLQCKTGTAALVGVNALWWFMLVKKVIIRDLIKKC